MKPIDSVVAFESFAKASGVSLTDLTPRRGIAQMLDFYASVAVEGCSDRSGDMLLFQWGTYDWGEGLSFEVNITRQFIETSKEDDDAISQLLLTFFFSPSAASSAMAQGVSWCKSYAELEPFRPFIMSSRQLVDFGHQTPASISLRHEYV